MRKKLAVAGIACAGAVLLGAAGTFAALTDTEPTAPVLVRAGTLDLALGAGDGSDLAPVTFADMVPGVAPASGARVPSADHYFVRLTNDGTLPGRARWATRGLAELENGCNAPERSAGDSSCGSGNRAGELGDRIRLSFSLMPGSDCTGTPGVVPPEAFPPTGNRGFSDIRPGGAGRPLVLAPGTSRCVRVDVHFPSTSDDNLAQSDSSTFQLRFRLDQT
jgi:predicted ribosomally synthesized peptide with SipW-like signal peptide